MRVKSNCEPARNPEEIPREIRIAVGILELESGAFAESPVLRKSPVKAAPFPWAWGFLRKAI